jgi:hypothetical protein
LQDNFYWTLSSRLLKFYLFIYLRYWGLNSGRTPWATPPTLFCEEIFQCRVSWTICLGWLEWQSSWSVPPE